MMKNISHSKISYQILKFSTLLMLSWQLSGCNNQTEDATGKVKEEKALPKAKAIHAETLWQSNQCLAQQEGARVLSTPAALTAWWQEIHTTQIPQPGLAKAFQRVDFNAYKLVVVNLGEQPSAGFGLEMIQEKAVVHKEILHLTFKRVEPAADSMQAQVITRPCVVLQADKIFEKVELRFQ